MKLNRSKLRGKPSWMESKRASQRLKHTARIARQKDVCNKKARRAEPITLEIKSAKQQAEPTGNTTSKSWIAGDGWLDDEDPLQ